MLLITSGPALAHGNTPAFSAGDTAWMLTSTVLVLFMTLPGLALFYGGLVRAKNVLSVLVQCFAIACVVTLLWLIYGYSITFAPGNGWLGGASRVMLSGMGLHATTGSIPETVFAMFQLTFAIITPALIVGSFAERMKFSSMILFSALWVTFVYFPVAHWVWGSGGWLRQMGLMDYAGGTVVHVTAGTASLVTALILGKRQGFPHSAILPHNMTMTLTGAGMLWVGWFGFNAGSALGANSHAGMAMLVTQISASAGALAWTGAEWLRYGKPSALGIVTGMVAGLGAITPAAGFVGPGGGLLIGLAAGVICFITTSVFKHVLHIDDSLDVFPVHGVGGVLGTLAVGILASKQLGVFSGLGYAPGVTMGQQFLIQILGVLTIATWTIVITTTLLKLIDWTMGLRVSTTDETKGLDTTQHNERGYNL